MKRRQFLSITAGALLAAAGTATAGVAWAASDPSLERGPGRGRGPHVGGEVTAVAGTTLTVATPHGSQQIVTSATTTFTLDGAAANLASITVGMHLRAEGTRADDGTFTATAIVAFSQRPTPPAAGRGPHVGGEVTAVAGTTLTVATPHGSQQIVTSATTTFTLDGAAATLASITVGMHLRAEGIRADDGTFTATAIVAFSEKPAAVRRGPPAWSNGRGPGSGGRGRGPAKLPTATPESGS